MFTSSLVLSSILFSVTALAAWFAKKPRLAYVSCWLAVLPAFCTVPFGMLSLVVLYHLFALTIFGSICAAINLRRGVFVAGSLAVFVGVYASVGVPRWRAIHNAIEMYPQESLVERLDYERARYLADHGDLPKPATADESHWAQMNGDRWNYQAYRRATALQALHANATALFENSPGFGVGRMRRGGLENIYEAEPIRIAQPFSLPQPPVNGYGSPITAEDSLLRLPVNPATENLNAVIAASVEDFLNPLAFGHVRDRGRVTGFLAHRFTKYPELPAAGPDELWRVESLDLISLLKHSGPVAYVSKNLPRMDELRHAPTRPLDEFETEQLAAIQRGEQFVAVRGPRRLRMLGALRAHDGCLNCHTANKGDLLGAFSYDFRLDRAEMVRK